MIVHASASCLLPRLRSLAAAAVGIASMAFVSGQASATTVDLGTANNAASWLITGGGAINATSFQIGGSYISLQNNANSTGAFVAGGSNANFDGFWTATDSFILPTNATNVSLTFSGLVADDRVALELNGIVLAAVGLGGPGVGSMSLTDVAATSYTFSAVNSGNVNSGFVLGGLNKLTLVVNNTDQGIFGATIADSAGDGTDTAVAAAVTYTSVPEPGSFALFGVGLAACGIAVSRRRIQNT